MNQIRTIDREALAIAHDSRIVQVVERAALMLERAWNTSFTRRVAVTPLKTFQTLSPRDRVSFVAIAMASAVVTHLVLRLL